MKYIRLTNNVVVEIIPEEDPELPGVPITERYPAKFITALIPTEDGVIVAEHYTYDPATGAFTAPIIPDPVVPDPPAETTPAT